MHLRDRSRARSTHTRRRRRALRRARGRAGRRRDRLHRARLLLPPDRDALGDPVPARALRLRPRDVRRGGRRGEGRGLPVKLGLEVDYVPAQRGASSPRCSSRTRGTTCSAPCTASTGSRSTRSRGLVDRCRSSEAWRRYFDALRSSPRAGLFDVLSHPDLVKFFGACCRLGAGYLPWRPRTRSSGRRRVEVSTAGLHKPVGGLYPEPELLRACARAGRADHARLGRARARDTSGATSTRGRARARGRLRDGHRLRGRDAPAGAARMTDCA